MFQPRDVGWSVLDVGVSLDGRQLVYSSWSDSLHFVAIGEGKGGTHQYRGNIYQLVLFFSNEWCIGSGNMVWCEVMTPRMTPAVSITTCSWCRGSRDSSVCSASSSAETAGKTVTQHSTPSSWFLIQGNSRRRQWRLPVCVWPGGKQADQQNWGAQRWCQCGDNFLVSMSSLFKLYSQVSFLDESTHLLASGGDDGLVMVWDRWASLSDILISVLFSWQTLAPARCRRPRGSAGWAQWRDHFYWSKNGWKEALRETWFL